MHLKAISMLPLWAQWVGLGAGIAAVVIVLAGGFVAWVKLFSRLNALKWSVDQIRTQSNTQLTLFGILVGSL